MRVLLRVLALVGAVAHGVNRLVARVLWFLPARVPGALLVAMVLIAAAAWSATSTRDAIAALPRPTEVSLAALTESRTDQWVRVRGLISGPHLDNSLYADQPSHVIVIRDDPHDHEDPEVDAAGPRQTVFVVGGALTTPRWYYVLRDPADPDLGLVVRSPRDAETIRVRTVRASVEADDDGLPLLAEIDDVEDDAAVSDRDTLREVGAEVVVRGSFSDAEEGDAGTWRYLVTDPGTGEPIARVDSPHPPNALPVELVGLMTSDAYRLGLVLETEEMRNALGDLEASTERLFTDGVGPLLPELSHVPALVLGLVAALLLASLLVGYPLFRRAAPAAQAGRRPVVGEPIPLEVDGVLPRRNGLRRLSGAAAELVWLSVPEFQRRAWQLRADADDHDDAPRLVLLASDETYLLPIDTLRPSLQVEAGDIVTASASRPGLRLRGPGIRAMLVAATDDDRDRAARELEPSTGPAPIGDPAPRRVPRPVTMTARPRLAAAVSLAAVALVGVVSAIVPIVTGSAGPGTVVLPLAGAAVLLFVARGVLRRAGWAVELLPSLALVGIVVAPVVAVAGSSCGSWLFPTLTGCPPPDPLGTAVPILATLASVIGLWAAPRVGLERTLARA